MKNSRLEHYIYIKLYIHVVAEYKTKALLWIT